ncbi:MAG: complex I NDUFA9 subunit family protein [Chromatiales bacterium]|nr:complex I NDUFA9 subunit family protein [Chromatiales bacterium]
MHIAIVGGSGFVGNVLADMLLGRGHEVTILSRNPTPRQLHPGAQLRVYEPHNFSELLLKDCTGVINLVGILNKRMLHSDDFDAAHVVLVKHIIRSCQAAGIRRYLHMSALHANAEGPSEYLKTKYAGEAAALQAENLDVTSFRPSVIFGPRDSFLNRFARLMKLLIIPIFPLACANTRFAPVYVNDLAERIVNSIDDTQTIGQCINLCGPKQYTLEQIVSYVGQLLGKNMRVISLPDGIAQLQGRVLDFVPGKPFSYDNYLSLQVDSVCAQSDSLCATSMEDIAPQYIKS